MPIDFRCSSCGQEYLVSDELAGRQARCKFCGELTRVVPANVLYIAPREHTTPSLHAPDLAAAAELEPPPASDEVHDKE